MRKTDEKKEEDRKGRCGEWLKELACRQREESRKEVESLKTKQESRSAGKFLPSLPLRPGRGRDDREATRPEQYPVHPEERGEGGARSRTEVEGKE